MALVLLLPLFSIIVCLEATKLHQRGNRISRTTVGQRDQPLTPKLSPESPSKFLGDYKVDRQPGVNKAFAFDHPYPAMQDTEQFDVDYVKDDNADGGKWASQFQYDELRTRIRKEEKKLHVAEGKVAEESEDVESAKKKEEAAAAKEKIARKSLEEAKEKEEALSKEVDKLEGVSAGKDDGKDGGKDDGKVGVSTGGEIAEATAKVEKEMQDLEDCQKNLEEAKVKVKKLTEEREKQVEKEKADATTEKAKNEKALENVSAKEREAEAEEEALLKNATSVEKKVKEEKAELDKAKKDYEHELEDVKKTEAELQHASERLSKKRHAGVDPDGGVYYGEGEKSGATTASVPMPAAWLMAIAAAAALSSTA